MSLFSTPRKRVTKEEFRDIINRLASKLDQQERVDIEHTFYASLYESGTSSGISAEEATLGLTWLRDNIGKHSLEAEDIDALEAELTEALKD
jgi:hypothetical protein